MKRYTPNPNVLFGAEESTDGPYVLFTDAQADKHAALKELAEEVLPYILSEFHCLNAFVPDDERNKVLALLTKLKSLTEGPV